VEAVTELSERVGIRIVGLLLVVAFASVVGLWTMDTSVVSGESLFAVYLSMDLVSFAMIAYIYRVTKGGDDFARLAVFAGCCMLLLLVFAGFSI